MKKIKIKFSGMTGSFDQNNNFITNILKKHYEIEFSDEPDYLIYSVNSMDYLKYNCVRIYYTPENLTPDFNICDYAIGFDYLDFGDRYIRYPIYLVDSFVAYDNDDYYNDVDLALHKHEISAEEAELQKKEFCSFVYSNALGAQCRQEIYKALSKYKKVNSGGRFLNNVGGPITDKLEFQRKHKFVIAFENTSSVGYTTEKIVHAFSAGAVPIYWGNPEICREFCEGAYINCHKYGLTEQGEPDAVAAIVEEVKKIDNDKKAYLKMLHTPAFTAENDIGKKKEQLEEFLVNIFAQPLEKAYRRNRFYWGERYERKQRIGMQYYTALRKLIPIRDFIMNRIKKQ